MITENSSQIQSPPAAFTIKSFLYRIVYISNTLLHTNNTHRVEMLQKKLEMLEKEWGVTLLERSKYGVKPTSDGMKLLPYAQNICADFDKLKMQVDELKGLQSGLIRIGTFSSVATHWLPNIIKEFQKDYPNIDYEILLGDYTEIEEWIHTGRVDCGETIYRLSAL